ETRGDVLGEDAVAEQRDGVADADADVESDVDGDVVHADVADDRMPPTGDHDLAVAAERPAPTVAVADRDRRDPRRLRGHEAAPVADALSRRERLDRGDPRMQRQRRLELARNRRLPEGVHAVDR